MRAVKVPRLDGGSIGPSTESCINCDELISMVWCLHQGNIYIKRKLRVWRDQKYIPLVGGITPLNCASRHNTLSRGRQYRAQKGKFGKLGLTFGHGTVFAPRKYLYRGRQYRAQKGKFGIFGRTYGHGTVFAPRKYLYQKEATGMERPEMYFVSRCNNHTYLCGPSKFPVSREAV